MGQFHTATRKTREPPWTRSITKALFLAPPSCAFVTFVVNGFCKLTHYQKLEARRAPAPACATLPVSQRTLDPVMLLSKEYVGYLAREVTKKLIAGELIETKAMPAVLEKVHASMLEELSLEDRINDEVRVILEAYSEEMRNSGANYQEMFRKVKSELVRKYKAVL